jgi:hypothetical protein
MCVQIGCRLRTHPFATREQTSKQATSKPQTQKEEKEKEKEKKKPNYVSRTEWLFSAPN